MYFLTLYSFIIRKEKTYMRICNIISGLRYIEIDDVLYLEDENQCITYADNMVEEYVDKKKSYYIEFNGNKIISFCLGYIRYHDYFNNTYRDVFSNKIGVNISIIFDIHLVYTTYKNGIQHGLHFTILNGYVSNLCTYNKGKEHGKYVEYSSHNIKRQVVYYSEGKKCGWEWIYDSKGNLLIKQQYTCGILHGDYIHYINGKKYIVGKYHYGKITHCYNK